MSCDVLYCVEHDARELDIACAVRAIVHQRYGLDLRLHFLANEFVASPDLGDVRLLVVPSCTSREFAHKCVFDKLPGVPVVNAACEQLFSPANRRYRMPRDVFARCQVLHLAAGEFYRRWLMAAGVPDQHIELTGSPTFQLYRPPYRQFYEPNRDDLASAYGLDSGLPWVLFPENFGAAFFKASHVRKRLRGGFDRRQLADYIDYSQRSFGEIAQWCCRAAARGGVELIVRPRPAMSATVLAQSFLDAGGRPDGQNLHFIKDGNVREWIVASDIVVSS